MNIAHPLHELICEEGVYNSKRNSKQVIERLTEEVENLRIGLQEYKTLIDSREKEILELTMAKDDIFEGSSDYAQMKKQLSFLKLKNKSLEDTIAHDNKLINEDKAHNERGAGRKSKFSDIEKETIRMYRIQGKTIKYISEMFSCSVGLIHKLIRE